MLEHIALWATVSATVALAAVLHFKARRLEKRVAPPEPEQPTKPLPAKEVLHA